jgi:hypothetical protein
VEFIERGGDSGMSYDKRKISIMRWINYTGSADMQRFSRSAAYILNHKSSPRIYQDGFNLSVDDPVSGMEVVENRWKPRGSRLFKHGICSYGDKDLSAEKAFEVTRNILNIYADYPVLFAVHDNIPQRIHAHFIMGMTSVYTGKKFSQGERELQGFFDHYNKTVAAYGLPTLRGYNQEVCDKEMAADEDDSEIIWISPAELAWGINSPHVDNINYYHDSMTISSQPVGEVANPLFQIVNCYRHDFQKFFNLGRMK